jgi:hypothetical protein
MRKYQIKYIPNRAVQDEVATHLEDSLNDLHSKGYDVEPERRSDGGYMLHAVLREVVAADPRVVALKVTAEELMKLMSKDGEATTSSRAVVFVTSVVNQLSSADPVIVKKEAPEIIKKLIHGMPADRIKQLATDCRDSIGHKPGECVKCDIYTVVADVLSTTASMNLS